MATADKDVVDYTPKEMNAKKRRQEKRARERGEEFKPAEVKEPAKEPRKKKQKRKSEGGDDDVAPPEMNGEKPAETGYDMFKRAREILKDNRQAKKERVSAGDEGNHPLYTCFPRHLVHGGRLTRPARFAEFWLSVISVDTTSQLLRSKLRT
eukprot:2005161-Pyramimonas_sp.AAC.1